jgi:hypothetical protein
VRWTRPDLHGLLSATSRQDENASNRGVAHVFALHAMAMATAPRLPSRCPIVASASWATSEIPEAPRAHHASCRVPDFDCADGSVFA